ncbi:MAG: IPT/TIG domain-containing protein [Deltaproteobacteria bacterium]
MIFRQGSRLVGLLATVPVALLSSGCGSDGSGVGSGAESTTATGRLGADGLAEPRFVFSPRDPGRAVGIRGIVTVDGQELTTAPMELRLTTSSEFGMNAAALTRKSKPGGSTLHDKTLQDRALREKAALPCPAKGDSVPSMGTINGNICYLSYQYASGQFGQQTALARTMYFAAEGIYEMQGVNQALYLPPDLLNLSISVGMGCLPGDGDGIITAEYISKLRSLGVSFGVLFYSFGVSIFTIPGQGPVRGLQHDTGIGYSIGGILGFVPSPVNFSYSIQTDPPPDRTMAAPMARYLRPWGVGENCPAPLDDENSLEFVSERLEELEGVDESSLEGALAAEMARGARPLFESQSSSGAGGPGPNVPAASNADFYAEFLSHSGPEPIEGAVDTSADGIQAAFVDASLEAGSDPSALLGAAAGTIRQVTRSVPSVIGEAALMNEAGATLQAGSELSELATMATPASQRFIAQQIRRVVINAGEPAHVELTSQEVADLVSRPVADVVGATVRVNAGDSIENATFTLDPEGLALDFEVNRDSLLVRFDVDLSTAAGDFPADVAEWVVRPSMVSIRVEAGPASAAFVTGPPSLASGAPASLGVQVVDANGRLVKRPYSVRFVDSSGQELGNAEADRGTAMLQFIPEASVPRVSGVEPTSINYQGGTYPGLSIAGVSFSEDLELRIDAEAPLALGSDYQVQSPEEVLLILPEGVGDGSHTLTVRNPEGVATSPVSFTVSAP